MNPPTRENKTRDILLSKVTMMNEEELILLSSDGEGTEEGEVAHPRKRTIRGPGWVGHDTFDPYCHFANQVKMDHEQVDYLRNYCDVHPHALYVCTMQKSQVVKNKGKMYFNKDFTETYLKNYISDKPKKISVVCGEWTERVNIKIGVDRESAQHVPTPEARCSLREA